MGCCCSCFGGDDDDNNARETEMTSANIDQDHKSMTISKSMSAPTIQVQGRLTVCGTGLALAAIPIEQDAAYWEWHLDHDNNEQSHFDNIMFGVASRKDGKFYQELHNSSLSKKKKPNEENGDTPTENGDDDDHHDDVDLDNDGDDDTVPSEKYGTNWMRKIEGLHANDVIGVAVQQSDLPMIQFLLNGELLHELAINRFRGTVYPSIYIPTSASLSEKNKKDGAGIHVNLVLAESQFKQMSPSARFGPVIVARSIV